MVIGLSDYCIYKFAWFSGIDVFKCEPWGRKYIYSPDTRAVCVRWYWGQHREQVCGGKGAGHLLTGLCQEVCLQDSCWGAQVCISIKDFVEPFVVLASSIYPSLEVSVLTFSTLYRLDVLVLNAGIGGPAKRVLTSDNLELTMATNHFGHFLLTNLLLGKLIYTSILYVFAVKQKFFVLHIAQLQNLN